MKIIKPNDAITVIKSQSPHIHDSVKCGQHHIQYTQIHAPSNHVLTNQLIRCQSNFQLTATNFSYQIFSVVSNSKSKSKVARIEFINQYIGNPLSFLVPEILVKLFHFNLRPTNTRENFVPMKISTEISCIDVEYKPIEYVVGRIEGN